MPQPNTSVSIKENALLQKILRKPKKRVKEKCEWYVSTIQVDLKMVQENTIIFPFWNEPMTIDYLWNPEVFNICNHSNFYNFIRFSPVPIPFSFFQVSWIVRLPSPWKIDLFISSYVPFLLDISASWENGKYSISFWYPAAGFIWRANTQQNGLLLSLKSGEELGQGCFLQTYSS